jgi:predicted phosphodiesterase
MDPSYTPSTRTTRIVCVSDTHNASPFNGTFKLPKGDVLIHAGDMTNQGSISELRKTVEWIEKADFEVKIVIAGMLPLPSLQLLLI